MENNIYKNNYKAVAFCILRFSFSPSFHIKNDANLRHEHHRNNRQKRRCNETTTACLCNHNHPRKSHPTTTTNPNFAIKSTEKESFVERRHRRQRVYAKKKFQNLLYISQGEALRWGWQRWRWLQSRSSS